MRGKKSHFTFSILRRTFATYSFVEWKKGLENEPSSVVTDAFLVQLAKRMNTSAEELKNTYIATQTTMDFTNQNLRRSNFEGLGDEGGQQAPQPAFAARTEAEAGSGDDTMISPAAFRLPSPQTSSDSSSCSFSSGYSESNESFSSDGGGGKMPAAKNINPRKRRVQVCNTSESEDEDESHTYSRREHGKRRRF